MRLIAVRGQNKNSIVLIAMAVWILNRAPQQLESVELVFAIPGHLFLPPDGVFGNIEQEIKNKRKNHFAR